jgi:hypothetical protein
MACLADARFGPEVGGVKGSRIGVGRRLLALGALALAGGFGLVVAGPDNWMVSIATVALLAGAAGAVVGSRHPLRNGALAGLVPLAVLVVAIPVQVLLGIFELAEGETMGSFLLELPFWLGLIGLPSAVLGMLGGAVVMLADRRGPTLRPR